jgi:hypothetical protein
MRSGGAAVVEVTGAGPYDSPAAHRASSMEKWSFGFYTYSNEKYELSAFPTGDFWGTPEEAFQVAASVYLSG